VIRSGKFFLARKRRVVLKRAYQKKEEVEAAQPVPERAVQISLPMAEVLTSLEQGLGELVRKVGRMFIESVLESEVEQMVGLRSHRVQSRQAYRWGLEQGSCLIDGQRVPIARPRVRQCGGKELPLGTYQLFQRVSPAEETVWSNIMRGLSMRDYKLVLQQFMDAYGLEKSTVSERFVEASRKKLEELMSRSLQHVQLCAVLIDGTIFKGQHLIAAIGIDAFGKKLVLGLVQGATENAKVVSGLLDHLAERGLDFTQPRLYLLDGSRALRAAVERHAGEAAFIQRCQVHKIRNILAYVPDTHQHWFKYKLRLAYAHADASDARQALYRLHDELNDLNPSAAASLMEGLEETLTLHELQVHARLRRSLSSTNGIESSFSVVETICRRVKRWQGSDHRLRWVASALLYAETRWNRLHGYRQLPSLLHSLQRAYQLRCNLNGITAAAHSAA
jgi:putative transposase